MIDPADQAADIASHGFRTTDRRKIETGDVADDVLRRQTGIVLARLGKDDKFIACARPMAAWPQYLLTLASMI